MTARKFPLQPSQGHGSVITSTRTSGGSGGSAQGSNDFPPTDTPSTPGATETPDAPDTPAADSPDQAATPSTSSTVRTTANVDTQSVPRAGDRTLTTPVAALFIALIAGGTAAFIARRHISRR